MPDSSPATTDEAPPSDESPAAGSGVAPPERDLRPFVAAVVVATVILGIAGWIFLRGSGDGQSTDPTKAALSQVIGPNAAKPPKTAPGLALTWFDGTKGSFGDLAGKPTVVNFFAAWCAPCKYELPAFVRAHAHYGDKIRFVGVDETEPKADGQQAADRAKVTYRLATDPAGEVLAAFGGVSMPTTVFLDANGKIVRTWSGQITDARLRSTIEKDLLG
jgi:thiol-disulfide isomerase/thioredoxin